MRRFILFSIAFLCVISGLSLVPAAAQTASEDPDLTYGTELLRPGTTAPDFTLKDADGKMVSLRSFRGKQVVLVFWASWCPDCRAEIPQLKAMRAATSEKKVAFVSVSFDRSEEVFRSFVTEQHLPGVQLFDPSGKKDSPVGSAYHVKWIPSLYLIDASGKVVLGTVVADKVAAALKNNR